MTSEPVLTIDQLVLAPSGKALSLDLFPGDAYAIFGPALSAKSVLMEFLLGLDRPKKGSFKMADSVSPHRKDFGKRQTPQNFARSQGKRISSSQLSQVLSQLGLWDVRQVPILHLPDEAIAATSLIPVFLSESPVAIIDGTLDLLDFWMRDHALEIIHQHRKRGRSFIVQSHLIKVVMSLGSLILFRNESPIYAGSVDNLVRSAAPTHVVVETSDPTTAQSMVESFAISVKKTQSSIEYVADKGQELAAKLLTHGYGSVRAVIVEEPDLSKIIRDF